MPFVYTLRADDFVFEGKPANIEALGPGILGIFYDTVSDLRKEYGLELKVDSTNGSHSPMRITVSLEDNQKPNGNLENALKYLNEQTQMFPDGFNPEKSLTEQFNSNIS